MILSSLLIALLITIPVEFAVLLLWLRRDIPLIFLNTVLINTFTLPLATLVYQQWLPNLPLVETGVILVEMVLIRLLFPVTLARALAISATANTISALIGLAWPW
jgi:hypothetical protein